MMCAVCISMSSCDHYHSLYIYIYTHIVIVLSRDFGEQEVLAEDLRDRRDRNPRPKLEPQIASLDRCSINLTNI